MHAETPTKLSLYQFSRIIGVNPLHFAGIDLEEVAAAHCATPWVQYEWQQGDRVGREAVARAIFNAETNIERYLGFRVLPTYEVDDQVSAVQPYLPELRGGSSNLYRTSWGYIVEPGRRAVTQLALIQQGSAPSLVDLTWEQDSYWMRAKVLATVPAGTDPCEVRVFYPGKGADPTWEIRPADVTISGTTATIYFRRECVVDQDLWDALEFQAAEGDADEDFLDTVDVYRVYTTPADQLEFQWEPWGLCSCAGDGCNACTIQTQGGCFSTRDPKLGLVLTRPGAWSDSVFTAGQYHHGRRPDAAKFSYLAGYQDNRLACPTLQMDDELAHAVAYYAAALLERPPCDCTVDSWEYWREDTQPVGNTRFAASGKTTPFGTRRGALYAWERVLERTLGQAVVVPV